MENLYCTHCGVADSRLEKKGIHIGVYCNGCDNWIKWLAQGEPTLHFGKYKGQKVAEIPDIPYLKWLIANAKLSAALKKAINERIYHIENVAK